jgi:hypothetical protein
MKRRSFLQQSALAAGSLFLPAQKMFAQDGSIILGQNDRKYKLNKAWSKADVMQFPVNDCHEMVQDKQGRIILLTNETKNNVMIYDRSGKLLSTWGHEYPGAHGLTLHNENGEDFLYICDNNLHKVFKTTIDGRVLLTLDYPKETGLYTKADEYIPTETAIAHNGDIYVADGYGKDFIIQYDAKGNYIRHFGGRGEGDKFLLNAHGVCMDYRDKKHPTLIVTSRQQNAFKRYTLDGEYINTIALPGAWVCRPVIKGHYLYAAVLQSNSNQWKQSGFVTILDKHFKVVANLGGSDPVYKDGILQEMTQTIKAFDYPHDVCIDNDENLYVAQWNSGKVYPYKLEPVS